MKEMIAIIRETKYEATVRSLDAAGIGIAASYSCMGRGKKSLGTQFMSAMSQFLNSSSTHDTHSLIPKRVLALYVEDDLVDYAVQVIMDKNSTRNPGDGKIFVIPVEQGSIVRAADDVA
ncbi:MAG: P-II family nitrogen regulator [Ruminococcus sp.]|nr:P-II family nitrogen regulator [Ruminococcus sp.]